MKKLLFIIACITLAACHFETSDNGKFDGFWQLTAVDSLQNGHSADMRARACFWSVQVNLLSVTMPGVKGSFLFRFNMEGDRLTLYNPVVDMRPSSGEVINEPVTDPQLLQVIGIGHLEEVFLVHQLTSTHMTLQNDQFRMYFRKY